MSAYFNDAYSEMGNGNHKILSVTTITDLIYYLLKKSDVS
jgi:hypothetical protein